MINAISIALSGLTASYKRVEVAASNIANVSTSGSLSPETTGLPAPYTAQTTLSQAQENGGVQTELIPKPSNFLTAYDPNSPFANADGVIGVPDVNLAEETVNLKQAEFTYKANGKVLEIAQELDDELLNILDDEA